MKRVMRLAILGTLGMAAALFVGRTTLAARLISFSLGNLTESQSASFDEGGGSVSVSFTDWLAGDLLSASYVPSWLQTDGATAQTMQAYAELHEARQDHEALVEERKKVIEHLEAKDQAIENLVDGKSHLIDTASVWLELDRSFGHDKVELINQHYPGNTETERYCHRIIRELELSAKHNPTHVKNALARARSELRVLQAQGTYMSTN